MRFLLFFALALLGCSAFEPSSAPPPSKPACGLVAVTPDLWATANHCPEEGRVVWRVPEADLKLIQGRNLKPWKLRLEPVQAGTYAFLRGRALTVIDPLRVSDGRFFLLTSERTDLGDSGFALGQGGELIGIAIRRQNAPETRGVFVQAGEIALAVNDYYAAEERFEDFIR